MTASEAREQIRADFNQYLQNAGVGSGLWNKAWEKVQAAVCNDSQMDADIRRHYSQFQEEGFHIEDGQRVYPGILASFSARHYFPIQEFVKRLEQVLESEGEAWMEQEVQKEDLLDQQRTKIFDHHYKHDAVRGEVIVKDDGIYLVRFEFIEGWKPPTGGKYQGKGSYTWKYPLTFKEQVSQSMLWHGMPVLFADAKDAKENYGIEDKG